MKEFKTPILLIVFNRPEITKKIIKEIEKMNPTTLFIAADGPRNGNLNDQIKCQETRKIINEFRTNHKIKKLFQDKNIGCRYGVTTAIDWFFKNVEKGIILEDDCLPSKSFFYFCEELLKKYEKNQEIMQINGSNFLFKKNNTKESYYYSKCANSWGWATWKRAWIFNDILLESFPKFKKEEKINKIFQNKKLRNFWLKMFNYYYYKNKDIDNWDIQWIYSVMNQNGLCITPTVNLISNIGKGQDATHTKIAKKILDIDIDIIEKIIHPKIKYYNEKLDLRCCKNFYDFYFFQKLINLILIKYKNILYSIQKK
jgi:hypothetical protein